MPYIILSIKIHVISYITTIGEPAEKCPKAKIKDNAMYSHNLIEQKTPYNQFSIFRPEFPCYHINKPTIT